MNVQRAFAVEWPELALDDPSTTFADVVTCLTDYTLKFEERVNSDLVDPLVLPKGLHDWVAYRLRYYEPTSGFARMILGRTDDDTINSTRGF